MPKINKYPDKNRRYTNMLCSTKENQTCLFNSFKMDLDQLKMLPICTLHQIVCFFRRNLCRSIIMWTKIGCSTDYDRHRIHSQIVHYCYKTKMESLWPLEKIYLQQFAFKFSSLLIITITDKNENCWYTNGMYIDCGIVYTRS